MKRAVLAASRSRESDIGRPRDNACCGSELVILGDAAGFADGKCRHDDASDLRTPRPWTFWCRGRSPGSQVAAAPGLPNAKGISDVKSGATRCLQLRGQRRNFASERDPPASLLATRYCDPMEP